MIIAGVEIGICPLERKGSGVDPNQFTVCDGSIDVIAAGNRSGTFSVRER
jgi:hypothetical protein